MAEGADHAAASHGHAIAEDDVGFDRDIRLEHRIGAEENRIGIDHGDARRHRGLAQPGLHHRLGLGQFGARIDAGEFLGGGFDDGDLVALGMGHRDGVGQIIFPGAVVVADGAQPAGQIGGGGAQHTGVAQVDGALCWSRVGPFNDPPDRAAMGDDAAVLGGIGGPERQ